VSDRPAAESPSAQSPPASISPWAATGATAPGTEPAAEAGNGLGLDAASAEAPELGRRSRRWADALAAIVLLVSAGAVLAAASPAIGRAFTPDPPIAAHHGVAQAIRLRGLQLGSLEDGLPSDGREPGPGAQEPGGAADQDPLGGASRSGPALERLGKWRSDGLGRPSSGEPERGAQGEDENAPHYRLGVATVDTVVRDRPEREATVLGKVAAGEVLLVAAAVEGWLYVALTTDQGTVVGWIPRTEVVLP
jgi:hypothetical protein